MAKQFVPPSLFGYTEGQEWYAYDTEMAKSAGRAGVYKQMDFEITICYRDVVRGYLPSPGKVAQDIQAQLRRSASKPRSKSWNRARSCGRCRRASSTCWVGADYPDATNFLDYHFGAAPPNFGAHYPEIWWTRSRQAARRPTPPSARRSTTRSTS